MNIQTMLFKLGVPTYKYTVETSFTGQVQQKIGDTLEVTVGWIYGMSTQIEGTTATDPNQILPNSAQIPNIYLNLKYGQSIYVNKLRMSDLVYIDPAMAPTQYINPQRYQNFNIPALTDLKQSYYDNPQAYTGITVVLDLWYIDITAYKQLIKDGAMFVNAKRYAPEQPQQQS